MNFLKFIPQIASDIKKITTFARSKRDRFPSEEVCLLPDCKSKKDPVTSKKGV